MKRKAALAVGVMVLSCGLLLFGAAGTVRAGARAERPLQLQLDLSGVSLGYHFSKLVFVGVTHHSEIRDDDRGCPFCGDEEDFRVYGQNYVQKHEYTYAVRDSLEVRFSPWEFGLYLAAGWIASDGDRQKIVYDEKPRVVGNSAYSSTGLNLEINAKPYKSPAVGVGANHVFDFGLSLGIGVLVGLKREDTPEILVSSFGSTPASAADLALFRQKVEDEYMDFPRVGMFHLAVGYNF